MKNLLIIASLIGILFSSNRPYVVVLGIAQDGGLPHAGCDKTCCKGLWETNEGEKVSCIGVVDPRTKQSWLIDATPDLPEQLRTLTLDHKTELAGIFLTHAHMGHYVGLLQLGREVMGAKDIPIYAMPRMRSFLENNGPWNQLVELENIKIQSLKEGKELKIGEQLYIEPFLVPHRDEYSETVGFRIMGPEQSLIYIPDIDKWEKWEQNIYKLVMNIDFALIDGTFFSQDGTTTSK
jgi:Predicted hydrolase of the metallo-beta-lactamase superfamily